jgi:hypothetical protein
VRYAPKHNAGTQFYLLRAEVMAFRTICASPCCARKFYLRCTVPEIATLLPARTSGSCRGPEVLWCHRPNKPGILASSPCPECGRGCPFACSPVHVSEGGLQSGLTRPQCEGEQILAGTVYQQHLASTGTIAQSVNHHLALGIMYYTKIGERNSARQQQANAQTTGATEPEHTCSQPEQQSKP